MRAAEMIRKVAYRASNEQLAEIIDRETSLAQLVEAAEMFLGESDQSGNWPAREELRAAIERVKGSK